MRIGIIGLGSMGGMLLRRFVDTGALRQEDILATTRTMARAESLRRAYPRVSFMEGNAEVARGSDLLFLCVKPVDLAAVAREAHAVAPEGAAFVDLNANVPLSLVSRLCPGRFLAALVPSFTAETGRSTSLLHALPGFKPETLSRLRGLASALGGVLDLDEGQLPLGSEIASCMPGFVAALVGVFAKEAAGRGNLGEKAINETIAEAFLGAALLLRDGGLSADELVARVATKGGITQEGVRVIREDFPALAARLFEETMAKRELIARRAREDFGALAAD
jgi:pyrroline-5-carboxylate reductase